MRLPRERGPLSRSVIDALTAGAAVQAPSGGPRRVLDDADAQLALWTLFELHYRGFDEVPDEREWDLDLIAVRLGLERRFLAELREVTGEHLLVSDADLDPRTIGPRLMEMVAADDGPSLAAFIHRHATREQVVAHLREKSLVQLKESDPQAFVVARLEGAAKTALAELQYDEFGAGRPESLHQSLYASAMAGAGLDPTYGAYVDEVSAQTLASGNVMSLFALNRSLRGAALGHFAAFEASSSVPSRKIAAGIERVGLPAAVSAYFHEHVEADAVHEQIATTAMCGAFVAGEPGLARDVVLGAACCLFLEGRAAGAELARWGVEPGPARGIAAVHGLEAAS